MLNGTIKMDPPAQNGFGGSSTGFGNSTGFGGMGAGSPTNNGFGSSFS